MKKIIAVLLTLCVVLSLGIPTFAAEPVANYKLNTYKDFITYNAPLTNTYKRLTEDRELNVVYFGGSVTAGYGATNEKGESAFETHSWRALSGDWFKENFHNATVRNYTAAIGGTGTYLGNIRLQSDVLSKKPDLVFIEFAINDSSETQATSALQFETMVREIRNCNPYCDIITILTTARGFAQGYLFPQLFPIAKAHTEISNAYNIPIIDVGNSLVVNKLSSNPNSPQWNNYFIDGAHPSSAGYREYYNCIEEYLNNALLNTDFSGCEKSAHKMPAVISEHLLDGDRNTYEGEFIKPFVEEAVGFELDSTTTWLAFPKHTGFYYTKNFAKSHITIKFTGTEFTIWTNLSSGSSVTYTVDNGVEKSHSFSGSGPKVMVTGLNPGEHTVVIKPANVVDTDEFRIYAFCTRNALKQTVKGTSFSHTHFSINGDWLKGDEEHYKFCECGEKFNISSHVFSKWEVTKEATETANGMKKRVCEICGKNEYEKFSLVENVNSEESTFEADADAGLGVSSFPVIPVAIGCGILVLVIIAVIIVLSKKKK